MLQRLSAEHGGEKLPVKDHEVYRNMVGSLVYLACWTHPDILFAVSELSHFVSAPGQLHMAATFGSLYSRFSVNFSRAWHYVFQALQQWPNESTKYSVGLCGF